MFENNQMVEYLYVDERRLNSYLGQFSSPVIHDRITKLKISLGLPPRIVGELDQTPREKTLHERTTALYKKLKELNELPLLNPEEYRWGLGQSGKKLFFEWNGKASRIFIPPGVAQQFKGLALWYSLSAHDSPLFLLEDFPRRDKNEIFDTSSFTIFLILLRDLEKELNKTIFKEYFAPLKHPSLTDPIKTFKQLGAQIGDQRNIWTLSRIRAIFRESSYGHGAEKGWTIFGYPIVIAETAIDITALDQATERRP